MVGAAAVTSPSAGAACSADVQRSSVNVVWGVASTQAEAGLASTYKRDASKELGGGEERR